MERFTMAENIDVHIVAALTGSDEEKHAAWEREMLRRFVAQWRQHEADVEARRVFEEEAAAVRREGAARLANLISWLEPYVDGTMGEVSAAMAAAYARAVMGMGALYRGVPRAPVALPVLLEPVVAPVAGGEEEERAAVAAAAELRALVVGQLAVTRERMALAAGGGSRGGSGVPD